MCALILQQSFGLLLANNDSLDLRGIHVDVKLPAHQEAHRGCKLGLGLQDLGRLLFNDKGTGEKGDDTMGWSTDYFHEQKKNTHTHDTLYTCVNTKICTHDSKKKPSPSPQSTYKPETDLKNNKTALLRNGQETICS